MQDEPMHDEQRPTPHRTPTFVVVGYVNRGKSSVISTLATDDRVGIDARPYTTRQNASFPLYVDGEALVNFVDTPGFERPREVRHWLKSRETDPGGRRGIVQGFLDEHRGTGQYPQECELLEPILAGGFILYVVDASKPPNDSATAEMEILQWTGQPRMALINPIRGDAHEAAWRTRLDQFFHLVRHFDAHAADFPRRVQLLRGLREVDERAGPHLERAIRGLRAKRVQQREAAASVIAETLAEMLTLRKEKKLPAEADPAAHREPLKREFLAELRDMEHRCRARLLETYDHHELTVEQAVAGEEVLTEDLFSESSWTRLGLSRSQLVGGGAAGGAVAGGAIDVGLGGADFFAGSVIGGLLGGIGAWYGGRKLAQTKVLGQPLGGKLLRIGPMTSPNFPWIVLDRAILFHQRVANQAHANRARLELSDEEVQHLSTRLDAETRKKLHKAFAAIRRPFPSEDARDQLRQLIDHVLQQAEGEQTEATR